MNLIITGPQGSGKGTQARLLAEKMGLVHLETGEMFRQIAEKNTAFGREVKAWINRGVLVPDREVVRLLRQILTREVLKKGFILDGSPRTLPQIKWLDKILAKKNNQIDKLIYLNISKKESIRRLQARRICPKCGRNYNMLTMPPKNDELCDECDVKLVIREDETPQAIVKRLKEYHSQTSPMINYYRKKGKVVEINGEQTVKDVLKDILGKLK
ncbi:MAG: adenylate kinase [Patescibacteria group bacterium]